MKIRLRALAVTTAAALALTMSQTASAEAARAHGPDARSTISSVAPEFLSGEATTATTSGATVNVSAGTRQVAVSTDAAGQIRFDAGVGAPLKISLPKSKEAKAKRGVSGVTFQGGDYSTVVSTKSDASVAVATVLENRQAPTRFEYAVEMPTGASLSTDEYGGAYVLGADGQSVLATVAPAWAKDANGRPVNSHYEVAGSTLVQVVAHKAQGVAYPVVADPWWGMQYAISAASANRLAALLFTGAGISGIVAAICGGSVVGIPCGVAYGVAAGLLSIGGGVISYCNANGRGIYLNVTWNNVIWCSSR